MKRFPAFTRGLLALAVGAMLTGCGSGGGASTSSIPTTNAASVGNTAPTVPFTYAQFDPTSGSLGTLPRPSDALLRNPSTGKNALPGTTSAAQAFNALSGFSTAAPIYVPLQGRADAATITAANVKLVTDSQAAAPVALSVLTSGSNDTIVITPTVPLTANTHYTAIVTSGVHDTAGRSIVSSDILGLLKRTTPLVDADGHSVFPTISDAEAAQLEALRQAWQPIWAQATATTGQSVDNIPVAFAFTTQPLYSTLKAINTATQGSTAPTPTLAGIAGAPIGAFFGTAGPASVTAYFTNPAFSAIPHNNIGGLYTGTFSSPDYISYADPANPAGAPWVIGGNGLPTVQSTRTQQFICCLPDPVAHAVPPGGYPTVIYVHGITRNLFDSLAVADAFNSQGIAVIAINQPLHGSNDLIPANQYKNQADGDGYGFINLNNLLTGRDNLRQSCADLYVLTRMINAGNSNFDNSNYGATTLLHAGPTMLGQSLGSIVSTDYIATEATSVTSVLNVGGGRIGTLLQNSPSFTPQVNAGLAAAGVVPGTQAYQDFFFIAQTVIDDGDSFNYGQFWNHDTIRGAAANSVHHTLLQEMIGDQTVPNMSTEDLARAMQVSQAYAKQPISGLFQEAAGPESSGLGVLYQFSGGAHGFMIDGVIPVLTGQCQTQVVTWFGLYFGGFAPTVTNIQPAKAAAAAGTPWFDTTEHLEGRVLFPTR